MVLDDGGGEFDAGGDGRDPEEVGEEVGGGSEEEGGEDVAVPGVDGEGVGGGVVLGFFFPVPA